MAFLHLVIHDRAGMLVRQNPTDEPASTPLEQIGQQNQRKPHA